ncbi:MAG: hypothetical protein E5W01_10010 [Mesorhizobium sp.]|nr:MAG: hypothetical protein E5W01_10010 [Mesorhizobium sp.]
MKTLRSHFRTATLALCAAGLFAPQATALPVVVPEQNRPIVLAASVCVIVVLVPGKDGQRPRRTEIVVPLN